MEAGLNVVRVAYQVGARIVIGVAVVFLWLLLITHTVVPLSLCLLSLVGGVVGAVAAHHVLRGQYALLLAVFFLCVTFSWQGMTRGCPYLDRLAWAKQPFDSATWKADDGRREMVRSLMSQGLAGRSEPEVVGLLGQPDEKLSSQGAFRYALGERRGPGRVGEEDVLVVGFGGDGRVASLKTEIARRDKDGRLR